MKQADNTDFDQRVSVLLQGIYGILCEQHVTTTEMVAIARQMTVSAVAQIASDNPQCDQRKLVEGILSTFRGAMCGKLSIQMVYTAGKA